MDKDIIKKYHPMITIPLYHLNKERLRDVTVSDYSSMRLRKAELRKTLFLFNTVEKTSISRITVIFDDDKELKGFYHGEVDVEGVLCPKQISVLGLNYYLKKRLGIEQPNGCGRNITYRDYAQYGRDNISLYWIGSNRYYADFSVK